MLGEDCIKLLMYYNNGISQCKLNVDKKFINTYENIKELGNLLNTKNWSIN